MNFYGEDLRLFYAEMGRRYTPNPLHNSSQRTAISGFWSLQACLAFYGMDPRATRLTLEGFGSVASYLAPFLTRAGLRVMAVSNHLGAAVNPEGLDLAAIVALRERHGSAWIDQPGDWRRLEREALFDVETDILIPCARVHSIAAEQARRIHARLVLPIANVPCTEGALLVFDHRGLDYVPDFVVNGGGVSGHIKDLADPFGTLFMSMLRRMLETARATRTPVRHVAEKAAHANYGRLAAEAYATDPLPLKIAKGLANRGLAPKNLVRNFQQETLERVYSNIEGLFTEAKAT
jgi:glutamate dehydrogenase (NAD(P)+)